MKRRLMLSSPETAMRLNRCTALVELRLPAGFHCLPVDEQNREIRNAASLAVDETIEALEIHRSLQRAG